MSFKCAKRKEKKPNKNLGKRKRGKSDLLPIEEDMVLEK